MGKLMKRYWASIVIATSWAIQYLLSTLYSLYRVCNQPIQLEGSSSPASEEVKLDVTCTPPPPHLTDRVAESSGPDLLRVSRLEPLTSLPDPFATLLGIAAHRLIGC